MHTHPAILNSRPYQLIEMHNYMYYINPTFNVHFDNSMIIIDLSNHDTSIICVTIPDMSGSDISMVIVPDMSGSDISMVTIPDMSGSDISMVTIPDMSQGAESLQQLLTTESTFGAHSSLGGSDISMVTVPDMSGSDISMVIISLLPIVTDMSGSETIVDIVDIKAIDQEPLNIDVDVKDVSDSSMILVGKIGDKSIIILSEDCSGIYLNKNADIIQVDSVKEMIDPSSCINTLRPLDASGQIPQYYHHSVYDSSRVVLDTSGSGHFHYHNPTVTLDIRGVPNYRYVIYLCEYHIKDVVDEIPTSTTNV
jgi:hypothetical protein